MWIVPAQRAALGFTEAEIAFLFPAPITRTGLVHFRLLSVQFRSLFGALILTLFTHRATVLGGNALTHALGWWLIFSALSLHFSGATFTLTQLAERGAVVWRRRALIAAPARGDDPRDRRPRARRAQGRRARWWRPACGRWWSLPSRSAPRRRSRGCYGR